MDKYLIIIAGPPATGKSYLVNKLKKVFDRSIVLSPDEFKIDLADSIGFNNQNEQKQLEKTVWELFYKAIEIYMSSGKKLVIIEYPFSDKQKGRLETLSREYNYNNITIRLRAEFEKLWERRKVRDRETNRHLSLIMDHYHYGDSLEDRIQANALITREEFWDIIEKRDYNNFKMGILFEVDVTDYAKVEYTELIKYISEL